MNHNLAIGIKIKNLRTSKNYTLKQLSEESGLSIGFLSQLERGISSIAIDSLATIAKILSVSLSSFFDDCGPDNDDMVVHGFEAEATQISPQIIQYILSRNKTDFEIFPRLFQLMPRNSPNEDEIEMYNHEGEEFIYVLEGILTIYVGGVQYILYPEDSIQIHSTTDHNWINRTNKMVKFLSINSPNPFITHSHADEDLSVSFNRSETNRTDM